MNHDSLVQTQQAANEADIQRFEESKAKWAQQEEREEREKVKVTNSLIKHLLDFKESQATSRHAELPTGNQIPPPEVHRASNKLATIANAAQAAPQTIPRLADFKTLREEAKMHFKEKHLKDGAIGGVHIENEQSTTPQDRRKAPSETKRAPPQGAVRYPPAAAADQRPIRPPSQFTDTNTVASPFVIHENTHVIRNSERKSLEQSKMEMLKKLKREHGDEESFTAPSYKPESAAALQPPAPGQLRRPH